MSLRSRAARVVQLFRDRSGSLQQPSRAAESPVGTPKLEHFPRTKLPEARAEDVRGWEFPAHLDNRACAWLQALKHAYALRITYPASLSPAAGQLLHALVLNHQPRVVVETGMFLGISTMWIPAALELNPSDAIVHSIDDFRPITSGRWRQDEILEGREDIVRRHLALAGLSHRVKIHVGNSRSTLQNLASELEKDGRLVDCAFLDADHSPQGVEEEFRALAPVLATGGLVVLHDIFPEISVWKGPRSLMRRVNTLGLGRFEVLDCYLSPANFGLGLIRRIG